MLDNPATDIHTGETLFHHRRIVNIFGSYSAFLAVGAGDDPCRKKLVGYKR